MSRAANIKTIKATDRDAIPRCRCGAPPTIYVTCDISWMKCDECGFSSQYARSHDNVILNWVVELKGLTGCVNRG